MPPEPAFLRRTRQDVRHTGSSRSLRRGAIVMLAVLVLIAVACFLWPNGSQIRRILINIWLFLTPTHWLRTHISPEDVEQGLNALVFVPLTACLVVAFPLVRIWAWWILAILGAISIEVFQLLFLPGRLFDPVDALFNATGGILGTLLGLVVLWLVDRRRRRR